MKINQKEFKDSLALLGLKLEIVEEISDAVFSNLNQIQGYLKDLKLETLSYDGIKWRFDINLANKSQNKICETEIILQMNFKMDGNYKEKHFLKTDVTNLLRLTNTLEIALNELKTNYCRRILKNII